MSGDIWDRVIARIDRKALAAKKVREDLDARMQARANPVAKAKPVDVNARWVAALAEATERCNGDRKKAVLLVAREQPKLRQQFVAQANANRR